MGFGGERGGWGAVRVKNECTGLLHNRMAVFEGLDPLTAAYTLIRVGRIFTP